MVGSRLERAFSLAGLRVERVVLVDGAIRVEAHASGSMTARSGSTGGIQRFKAGQHGAQHERAAMIGYVQANDVTHWHKRVGAWIDALVTSSVLGWSVADKLTLARLDKTTRVATLVSTHDRKKGTTSNIQIDHLCIEMLRRRAAI